jgi:hypothetical protein
MGVNASESLVTRIGETAGVVWCYLDKKGTVPLTKLIEDLDESRDLLMQAVGWLAREDKIHLAEASRRKTIALKRG